jgi:adenylate kinase
MNIVILGPQGSGKGTQAKLLAGKFHLFHLEMGNVLRAKAEEKTPPGEEIADLINKGMIVPDEITFSLVQNYLTEENITKGLIFDGFPRRVTQAQWIDVELSKLGTQIDYLIYLELSKEESLRRLSGRRHCPQCNRNYNLITMPPKSDELCDDCQIKLIIRDDETPEAIAQRLENFQNSTYPVVAHYEKQNKVLRINGEPPVETVFKEILGVLR